MASIIHAVEQGVRKAQSKSPDHIHVARGNADVSVIKAGVVLGLRNWVVDSDTGEASCKAYLTSRWGNEGPLESTLRGGSIEEIIWSVVMAVAMGAYDHVPD